MFMMADLQDPRFNILPRLWFYDLVRMNEARDIHSRLDQQRAKMFVPTRTPRLQDNR